MPLLDVSEALTCPMFNDTFNVRRRIETVNDHGESEVSTQEFRNVSGVITSAGSNDLQRLPEDQRMGRILSLISQFRLRGPAKDAQGRNFQPDEVLWTGSVYVVVWVDPYQRYGSGFVQTLISSKNFVDPPPV